MPTQPIGLPDILESESEYSMPPGRSRGDIVNAVVGSLSTYDRVSHRLYAGISAFLSHIPEDVLTDAYNQAFGKSHEEFEGREAPQV